MTDEELSVHIDDSIDKGFATQDEIAKLFHLKKYIIEKRIMEEGEGFIKSKWSAIVRHISENFEMARPSDVVRIVKDENGNDVDKGLGAQVRFYASRGLDRDHICEMLRINPASFNIIPRLEQEFRYGESESRYAQKMHNEQVLVKQLIKTQWFERKGLPTWKKLAEGYIVELNKDEYQVKQEQDKETGKTVSKLIFVKRTVQQKEVKPDKDALKMLTQIAGQDLLTSSLTEVAEIDAGMQITNEPTDNFDEGGRFIVQDAEFEEIDDDK